MSINNQISRINNNISDAYDELEALGADMPTVRNSANLATAINSLNGKYYTKQEIDVLLANKSNVGHKHTLADITDAGNVAGLGYSVVSQW